MSRAIAALLGAALVLLSGGPAAAARTAPGALSVESADVSGHPTVVLEVTAPATLAGQVLDIGDFSVTEDGAARELESATRSPGAEQAIVLVIDVSGSMAGAFIAAAKAAASEFVARAPDGARIAVVAFGTDVTVASELTADKDALIASIAALELAGDTALFDAVTRAADLIAAGDAATATIIVLSDGEDTASQSAPSTVVDRLVAAGASFYGIQLGDAVDGAGDLASLVASVRGTKLTATDAAGLAGAYDALAVNSGNRYTVRYTSGSFGSTELNVGVNAYGVSELVTSHLLDLPQQVVPETTGPSQAPAVVAPSPGMAGAPGWLGSSWALVAGLGACYAAVGLLAFVVLRRSTRVSADRRNPSSEVKTSRLSASTDRVSGLIDQAVQRGAWSPIRVTALQRAGVAMRLEDFILIVLGATMAAAAAGLVVSGVIVAILAAVATPLLAKAFLKFRAGRRQAKFADQLDDSLQLMAGSLRAGHSLLRAIDAVSHEAEAPTSEEFARVMNETRLGRDLGQALEQTAARMGSDDFSWTAQAVAIHRDVGGNLAEVLDSVAHTIRERNEIRRQVKALSAEGKLSAYVLMALPFGIAGFLSFSNPEYIGKLTQGLVGYAMLAVAIILLTVGGLWLRKVVTFQF